MKKKGQEMMNIKNIKKLWILWILLIILPLYAYSENSSTLSGHWTIRVESYAYCDSVITEDNYSLYFRKYSIYPNACTEIYLYNDMNGIICIPSQSPLEINWSVINDTIFIATGQYTKEYTIIAYNRVRGEIIIAEKNVPKGENRHLYILRGREHNFDDFVYNPNIHFSGMAEPIDKYLSSEVVEENLNAICIGIQNKKGEIHYNYISAPIEERLRSKEKVNILFLMQDCKTNGIKDLLLVKTIYNEFLPCKREIREFNYLGLER